MTWKESPTVLTLTDTSTPHGSTGIGLAFSFFTGVAWEGIQPGLAPVLAAAAAGLALAWTERRRSAGRATVNPARPGRTSSRRPVEAESRHPTIGRWTVSPSTGKPELTWK